MLQGSRQLLFGLQAGLFVGHVSFPPSLSWILVYICPANDSMGKQGTFVLYLPDSFAFLGIYFDGHLWYNFFCNIKIICTEVHLCKNFISKSLNTQE